jgi:hypothetical protein
MTSARDRAEVNFCRMRLFPRRDPLRFHNRSPRHGRLHGCEFSKQMQVRPKPARLCWPRPRPAGIPATAAIWPHRRELALRATAVIDLTRNLRGAPAMTGIAGQLLWPVLQGSIRSVVPRLDRAVRPGGPDRDQTKSRRSRQMRKPG